MSKFTFVPAQNLKEKQADSSKLGFGKLFTDYMLTARYTQGQGWHDHKIEPYAPFAMDPASMVFHYGQAMFEGMKAYKTADGRTLLFRPLDNFKRMNNSGQRMAMAQLDPEEMLEGLVELIKTEEKWIPTDPGTSLYIRPTMIATDAALGVHASKTYLFYIILSPVGPYYAAGFNPVKIYVEDEYVRAVRGGTGFTKCAGNYAASILAGNVAESKGYTQVLWLDGVERKYIEEVGAMNMFFVIDGELITPPLLGSILPGITRDSIIKLARHLGYKVSERRITIQEVFDAHAAGKLDEAFGTGTAAVVSPVGELNWDGKVITINNMENGPVAVRLYEELTGIQYGRKDDPFGWVYEVK